MAILPLGADADAAAILFFRTAFTTLAALEGICICCWCIDGIGATANGTNLEFVEDRGDDDDDDKDDDDWLGAIVANGLATIGTWFLIGLVI